MGARGPLSSDGPVLAHHNFGVSIPISLVGIVLPEERIGSYSAAEGGI